MDSCCMFNNWKSEHHMCDQKIFMSTHKGFMSTHKEHFFVILNGLPLIFGYKTAADRGERDSHCLFNNWKSEPPMSAQKTFVSAHKTKFDLYDRSYMSI